MAGEGGSGSKDELRALVAQVRTNLALRGRSGLQGVPARKPAPAGKSAKVVTGGSASETALRAVRADIGDCKRCRHDADDLNHVHDYFRSSRSLCSFAPPPSPTAAPMKTVASTAKM